MDNYSHLNEKVIYIEENIPGPTQHTAEYKMLTDNYNSQLASPCCCENNCEELTCECLIKSGGFNYIKNDRRSSMNLSKSNYPIFECNILCQCKSDCANRYVQHGPLNGLIIKPCISNTADNIKGLGLFSKEFIPAGTFVCEYAGEIITMAQAIERQKLNLETGGMNYIFCLNEHSGEHLTQTIIDPSEFGNIGRYVNHSCEPNCLILPVRINSPIPKLGIFTSIDISPDTEITFDYGPYNIELDEEYKEAIAVDIKRIKCLCNSKKCRGWMPFQCY